MTIHRMPRRVKELVTVRNLSRHKPEFLTLTRRLVRNRYEDGELSPPYRFEMVERRGIDSVALIPFWRKGRNIWIIVKAGFRPALYLRGIRMGPGDRKRSRTVTIEAVAGSLEPGDQTTRDIDRRALKELAEETGFRGRHRDLIRLGAGFFPSHGQCTEMIHLRAIAVDPSRAALAPGDGSVNEMETWTLALEAKDLLSRCRHGEIQDPKLEIGVSRLLGQVTKPGRRP